MPAPSSSLQPEPLHTAHKAAHINVLEVRAFGSFGRVYLGGEERDIDIGYRAAEQAIREIKGRKGKV